MRPINFVAGIFMIFILACNNPEQTPTNNNQDAAKEQNFASDTERLKATRIMQGMTIDIMENNSWINDYPCIKREETSTGYNITFSNCTINISDFGASCVSPTNITLDGAYTATGLIRKGEIKYSGSVKLSGLLIGTCTSEDYIFFSSYTNSYTVSGKLCSIAFTDADLPHDPCK